MQHTPSARWHCVLRRPREEGAEARGEAAIKEEVGRDREAQGDSGSLGRVQGDGSSLGSVTAALWGESQRLAGESHSGSLGRVTAARWDEVHGSVHGAGGRWLCPRLSGQ